MENTHEYEVPRIVDYGDIKELTATNLKANVVDLPLGTVLLPGQVPLGLS